MRKKDSMLALAPVLKIFLIILGIILLIWGLLLIFIQLVSKRPSDLGIRENKLKSCPPSDNCVCSQADPEDELHYISPLNFTKSKAEMMIKIENIINSLPRTKIIAKTDSWIHIEFRSLMWRFIDDIEIYLDDSSNLIHFRSASRIGTQDYGANRNRIEEIKKML